jgi:1,2-phenylacetyl-CoA epoxidase PaaB subunit
MVPQTVLNKEQADSNPTDKPFSSLVGALLYIAVSTRPDVSFAVNKLAKFLTRPAEQHWLAAVQVLGYLVKTKNKGIKLGWGGGEGGHYMFDNDERVDQIPALFGFSDSDWANDTDYRKSVSGGIVLLKNSVVAWSSKRQLMVATSTTEAETHAALSLAYNLMMLRKLAAELWCVPKSRVRATLFVDNQPSIDAIKSGTGRTKHYDVKLKFLQQCIGQNEFSLEKVGTNDNLADVLTKPLQKVKFDRVNQVILDENNGSNF